MLIRIFPLILLLASGALWAAPAPAVGQITLVIGGAQVWSVGGEHVVAVATAPVRVGDRIDTQAGGHVHVRFTDGGLVSVRPGSVLTIEAYQQPEVGRAAIKLRLDQGAVRSVTGQWGEVDRSGFRLNTPIAAIGVRGTDFVVQADLAQVRAAVLTGAIVVAPYGQGCAADRLGPCSSPGAATLAADMGPLMLELRAHETRPRLVPLADLPLAGAVAPVLRTASVAPSGGGGNASEADLAKERLSESRGIHDLPRTANALPVVPVLASRWSDIALLAWARWGALRPGDAMTVTQADARQGDLRQIATGSLDSYYLLYRENGRSAYFPTTLGTVDFTLGAAQALLNQGKQWAPVAVTSGSLGLDFAARQFRTQLGLDAGAAGRWTFASTGAVDASGVLLQRGTDGSYVTGALAHDASLAGYAFGMTTGAGNVAGVANWVRR